MAKESVKARARKTPKFASRVVRRCFRCGRSRGIIRMGVDNSIPAAVSANGQKIPNHICACRICLRELILEGMVPGVKKSSW
jgi:small subunit ribosomal protein S14